MAMEMLTNIAKKSQFHWVELVMKFAFVDFLRAIKLDNFEALW